jgi:hypothetical protein
MKHKLFIFLIILLVSGQSFSQMRPETYSLNSEKKYLSKTNSANPVSNSISDIITIGDTVWLATTKGVSVSFDRGNNWTNFYGQQPFGEDGISAIGYNKGVVWAATVTTKEVSGVGFVDVGTGLKYTINNGATWMSVPQPVDDLADSVVIYGINRLRALPVTVAEQNLTYDFAFTPGAVWITSWAGGLRRSTDMGHTWQRMVLPPDDMNSINPNDTLDFCYAASGGSYCNTGNYNHVSFSVLAVDDTVLYVGTADGINKTTNAGDQYPAWVKFNHTNQDEPISGNFVTALAYNVNDNIIWASTWKANDENEFYAVSSSTDGGASWNTFLKDEKPHNFGFKGLDVIAATDDGAFRSSDEGGSWILPNNIVDKNSGVALSDVAFYCAASQGEDIWLGSGDGLAKLTETGFWSGDWKIYFASAPVESANETYCYPNPFSPKLDILKIKYSTGGVNKKITIRIFDFAMNIVKTVIQNADRIKTLDDAPDKWDGRDENGDIVPNGVYFYRIDFDSGDPVFGKIIVLQ